MKLLETAGLLASYAAWRALPFRAPGEALVRGLESSDPNNRMIAGMFLVRAGARAVPIVRQALVEKRGLPAALSVAGDLGAPELKPLVESFASHEDPAISRAAVAALQSLHSP